MAVASVPSDAVEVGAAYEDLAVEGDNQELVDSTHDLEVDTHSHASEVALDVVGNADTLAGAVVDKGVEVEWGTVEYL